METAMNAVTGMGNAVTGVGKSMKGLLVSKPKPVEFKRAQMADGCHLHYTDTGASDLPALIMLHGAGSYGTKDYQATGHVDGLSSVCRVIVVDYRGHGESCHIPAGTCTLAAMADDLAKLMEILELSPSATILYGMSAGWAIVLTYIRKHGAGLKGLICEDMIPVYPPGKAEGYQGFFGPEMAAQLKPALQSDIMLAMGGFKDFIFPPGIVADEMTAEMWPKLQSNFCFVSPENWASIFDELSKYDCVDVLPKIKEAKTPGLVMSGKSGFNPDDKVKEAEAMGATVIVYEKSGHFIHMTESAKAIADMVAFIKGL